MQTRPVSEILIVDDCSTDNTSQLIGLAQKHFPLIKYIQLEKNSSAQNARHVGIHRVSCEWIGFLNSDDEWLSQRVQLALETASREGVSATHCEYIRQNADGSKNL
jgi:teichuronic acid biosynthesis glycosyltransferase TuaG